MDECLPLASLDASTLRMLLTQERETRAGLEQEVGRLQAGLGRQNERIMQLEQLNAQLQAAMRELQTVSQGLDEQNTLLRQQVATLQIETARLRGDAPKAVHQPEPWPSERTKQDTPPKPRRKRDKKHNHGRQRSERVDETNNQAERNLRPLVIARKVSGGTRSSAGSNTRMILASLAATARLQGVDPAAAFQQLLIP